MRAGVGEALVTILGHSLVHGEPYPHQQLAAPRMPRCRHDERQRPHQVWDDAGKCATLADEEPRLREVEALQRSQTAVKGLEDVERSCGAEIVFVDDGHRELALAGVPGRGDAI